jgi:hypothetical protein
MTAAVEEGSRPTLTRGQALRGNDAGARVRDVLAQDFEVIDETARLCSRP